MTSVARPPLALLPYGFADPAWLDTAVSRALMEAVAAGEAPESLRIFRPGRVLAFGPADRFAPGYDAARASARAAGFVPVERLAGGRAAVFHEGTIALAWTFAPGRVDGIRARFAEASGLVAEALRRLGVDARVGEVPGEYCPGAFSVNAGGRTKLAGLGQRVTAGAAHVGGVIVVDGADLVREPLRGVYAALGIDWDPATAGGVSSEVGPVTWDEAASALLEVASERHDVRLETLDPAIVERAAASGRSAGAGSHRAPAKTGH